MNTDELMKKLLEYGDPESAIALYKEATTEKKKLEDFMKAAKAIVEKYLRDIGEFTIVTKAGKASYTQPKKPRLNTKAWKVATTVDAKLQAVQSKFDASKNALEIAQEPFMELPKGSLRIT